MPQVLAQAAVIIPCYNGGDFLGATLASIQGQTLTDWEVVVVNDGSKDDSLSVMKRYAEQDARIRYLDQANAGVSASRNNGFALTTAPYVTFLDADDLLLPESLHERCAFLTAHPAFGAVTTAHEAFDSNTGKALETIPADTRNLRNRMLCFDGPTGMLPSSVMMTREAFEAAGQWDTQLSTSADQDLWVRLADVTQVGSLNTVLTRYRIHAGQMHRNIKRMKQDVDYLFAKAKRENRFVSPAFYRYAMARKSWVLGASFLKDAKDTRRGVAELFRSFGHSPRYVLDQLLKRPLRLPPA